VTGNKYIKPRPGPDLSPGAAAAADADAVAAPDGWMDEVRQRGCKKQKLRQLQLFYEFAEHNQHITSQCRPLHFAKRAEI